VSRLKLVVILLLIATIAWCGVLVYATTTQVSARLYLSPGDKFITAIEVLPTENQSVWRHIEKNLTLEAEYQGELEEPLNIYVKTAIEHPHYFVVLPKNESFPIEWGVYRFKESYYFLYGGVSEFYVDAIDPELLKRISETRFNLGIAGIPLFGLWAGICVYYIKQRKTSPTKDERKSKYSG